MQSDTNKGKYRLRPWIQGYNLRVQDPTLPLLVVGSVGTQWAKGWEQRVAEERIMETLGESA